QRLDGDVEWGEPNDYICERDAAQCFDHRNRCCSVRDCAGVGFESRAGGWQFGGFDVHDQGGRQPGTGNQVPIAQFRDSGYGSVYVDRKRKWICQWLCSELEWV